MCRTKDIMDACVLQSLQPESSAFADISSAGALTALIILLCSRKRQLNGALQRDRKTHRRSQLINCSPICTIVFCSFFHLSPINNTVLQHQVHFTAEKLFAALNSCSFADEKERYSLLSPNMDANHLFRLSPCQINLHMLQS